MERKGTQTVETTAIKSVVENLNVCSVITLKKALNLVNRVAKKIQAIWRWKLSP